MRFRSFEERGALVTKHIARHIVPCLVKVVSFSLENEIKYVCKKKKKATKFSPFRYGSFAMRIVKVRSLRFEMEYFLEFTW